MTPSGKWQRVAMAMAELNSFARRDGRKIFLQPSRGLPLVMLPRR
jgi:hypothetical protein